MLTVLGTTPQSARYFLNGGVADSPLAPVALYKLLPDTDRPARVIALCTPEAKKESWPLLQNDLDGQCETELIKVPAGETEQEINCYMETAATAISDHVDITVDMTHGFRHFSFLTYMVTLYVSTIRDVKVRGAYYGLLRRDEPSPFLDMSALLQVSHWLYAIKALSETGNAMPISDILQRPSQEQSLRRITENLTRISEAYISGLPLEFGQQVGAFRKDHFKPLRKLISETHRLPLARDLVGQIADPLKPFTLATVKNGWKGRIRLTDSELKRQVRHIERMLRHRHVATALGLMNEWTVSWVLWQCGQKDNWLDREVRRRAGTLLNAFETVKEDTKLRQHLNEEQRELGSFWGRLRNLRNGYAHHGMRPQSLVDEDKIKKNLCKVLHYWEKTLCRFPTIALTLGERPGQRILVSPIGMRPGVFFSALQAYKEEMRKQPDLCLIICSHATEGKISEAAARAGYRGRMESFLLEDPFGTPSEIERLAKAARPYFVGASAVFVNVTGGTTLMGLVAEKVAKEAQSLACPVRRFGLIDPRPPTEQEMDPWEPGEAFWIDGGDGNAGTD